MNPIAPVAQLDRALPSEGKGHTFESCRVRQPSFAVRDCLSGNSSLETPPLNVAGEPDGPAGAEREQRVTDGLYTLGIEMSGAKRGHATGVVVLQDGRIMGG